MAPSTAGIELQEEKKPKPRWLFQQKTHPRPVQMLTSAGLFLLPSFLVAPFRPGHPALYRTTDRPTAYLDGLRGIAALIVYFYHFAIQWRLDLVHGYGTPAVSPNNQIIQAVPFRLLISGRASVSTFFVISGYVLSTRALRQIYSRQDPGRVLATLSGSFLRRPFRLYLPIITVTAFLAFLVQLPGAGIWWYKPDPVTRGGVPPIAPTPAAQFSHWLSSISMLAYPFRTYYLRGDRRPVGHIVEYDGPLWTIPTEFKGSVIVFSLLLAFSRARNRILPLAFVFLGGVAWQFSRGDADTALFCAGMFLAELDIAVPATKFAVQTAQRTYRRLRWTSALAAHILHHVIVTSLFAIAVYLLCFPEMKPALAPGFRTLSMWTPVWYIGGGASGIQMFWISVGSALLVATLVYAPPLRMPSGDALAPGSAPLPVDEQQKMPDLTKKWDERPLLQWPFITRFAQYMGTISFSLYLVHECVDHFVGTHWSNPGCDMWRAWDSKLFAGLPAEEFDAYDAEWKAAYRPMAIKGWLFNTIVLIWVSDIVTRIVDLPSIALTRKISAWIEVPKEEKMPSAGY